MKSEGKVSRMFTNQQPNRWYIMTVRITTGRAVGKLKTLNLLVKKPSVMLLVTAYPSVSLIHIACFLFSPTIFLNELQINVY